MKLGRIRDEEMKRESQGPGLDIGPRTHPYGSLPSAKPHLLKFPKIAPPSEVPTSLFWVGQKRSEALHIKPQKTSVPTGQIYFCKSKPPLDVNGFPDCMADRENSSGSHSHNPKITT